MLPTASRTPIRESSSPHSRTSSSSADEETSSAPSGSLAADSDDEELDTADLALLEWGDSSGSLGTPSPPQTGQTARLRARSGPSRRQLGFLLLSRRKVIPGQTLVQDVLSRLVSVRGLPPLRVRRGRRLETLLWASKRPRSAVALSLSGHGSPLRFSSGPLFYERASRCSRSFPTRSPDFLWDLPSCVGGSFSHPPVFSLSGPTALRPASITSARVGACFRRTLPLDTVGHSDLPGRHGPPPGLQSGHSFNKRPLGPSRPGCAFPVPRELAPGHAVSTSAAFGTASQLHEALYRK